MIIIGHSYAICTNARPKYSSCVRYLGHIGLNSHWRIACEEKVVCYGLCEYMYIRTTLIHKLTPKSHLDPFPPASGDSTWSDNLEHYSQDRTTFVNFSIGIFILIATRMSSQIHAPINCFIIETFPFTIDLFRLLPDVNGSM